MEDNLEETLNGVKESVVAYVEPNTKSQCIESTLYIINQCR